MAEQGFDRRILLKGGVTVSAMGALGALGSATASIEREPSGVVDLAAAGGIERGLPQHDGRTRLLRRERRDVLNHRIEFVNFRTIVVKTLGHNPDSR